MTKAEQESIFRWDSEEEVVHVYTCHPPVRRKLVKAGYSSIKSCKQRGKETSWSFRVPLDQFRWRIGRRKQTGGRQFAAIIAGGKGKDERS